MMNLNAEIKEKIIRVVHALVPKATIYLFGSRALGQHHKRSDIDLALDTGAKLDRLVVGEVRDILNASNMPYQFDVVDVHNVNKDLKQHILDEGIIWATSSSTKK